MHSAKSLVTVRHRLAITQWVSVLACQKQMEGQNQPSMSCVMTGVHRTKSCVRHLIIVDPAGTVAERTNSKPAWSGLNNLPLPVLPCKHSIC